ncbi:hypothetical protein HHK36_017514 [Tetracentron sinense]|uniref:Bromodomain associated domain-containing protein n=1 Tax=Tetracentron sinense TaxID=13715 RepID=A0A835DBZ3_TETSI|nr:hypothetical protein HHK36_017514 [Tetracentron sinense]
MNGNAEEQTTSPSISSAVITRVAVAQICQSIGFTSSQRSALDALTNIAKNYLQTLAKSASSNANSCGRTESNLFDVIHAIEDLRSIQGFHGASEVNQSLLNSGVLREIISFVRSVDEIPFAKPIPRNNSAKNYSLSRFSIKSKQGVKQNRPFSHIPPWLPVLPGPSTYKTAGIRVSRDDRSSYCEEEQDGVINQIVNRPAAAEKKNMIWEEKRDLPVERPRVRFKLGLGLGLGFGGEVGLRNGVCRGGKRVSLHNRSDEDGKRFKRRR